MEADVHGAAGVADPDQQNPCIQSPGSARVDSTRSPPLLSATAMASEYESSNGDAAPQPQPLYHIAVDYCPDACQHQSDPNADEIHIGVT